MKKAIFLLIVLFVFGCASNRIYQTAGGSKLGKRNYGTHAKKLKADELTKGKIVYMMTSYYGKKFQGKRTSSGEIFDMNKLTCAHKTLPFGTRLKVINESNGKSVVVRVNDRGPFVAGRDLDLSFAAARKIGLIGIGVKKLKVIILE